MIENGNAKQTNDQNAKYAEEANQGDVKGFVGTRHPNIDAFCSRPPQPQPPTPPQYPHQQRYCSNTFQERAFEYQFAPLIWQPGQSEGQPSYMAPDADYPFSHASS